MPKRRDTRIQLTEQQMSATSTGYDGYVLFIVNADESHRVYETFDFAIDGAKRRARGREWYVFRGSDGKLVAHQPVPVRQDSEDSAIPFKPMVDLSDHIGQKVNGRILQRLIDNGEANVWQTVRTVTPEENADKAIADQHELERLVSSYRGMRVVSWNGTVEAVRS